MLRVAVLAAAVWVVLAVGLLIVGWLYSRAGLGHVERATASLAPEDVVVGNDLAALKAARNDFGVAHLLGEMPMVRSFEGLPFVGRQLHAVRALNGAAHDVLAVGVHAVERSQDGIAGMKQGGAARVSGMRLIASVAAESRTRVDAIHLGSSHGLVGPLAHAQDRFARRIPKLTKALGDLHEVATGLTSFLDGPRLYLVFAANNNEMRLGSGSFLSASLLSTKHGKLTLFPMQPTAPLKLGPARAARVPMPPDQKELWGWLAPNDEWRNLASSPRFDTTAQLSRRMMQVREGLTVDGVLAIDPVALNGIVGATGPVGVGGRQLSGDALLKYVFIDQYHGVSVFDTQQRARRDALGGIAQEAIGRLDAGHWDTRALVRALRTVGRGRHVLAWSARRDEQRAWHIAGVDGALPDDSLFIGVHNRGGNKLDPFLDVRASVSSHRTATGVRVGVIVQMHNTAPNGLPRYVGGPYPGARNARKGTYQGILAFYIPGDATDLHVSGRDPTVSGGRDGKHRVVAMQVHLDRTKTDTVGLTFALPNRAKNLIIEPSARYPSVRWADGALRWQDTDAQTVRL
ncbi:MAG: hypothetical protein JWL83_2973 [Actinomycetia bacterium]|nr:hypothetical protein [Actinomycetes bacterium]